MLTQYILTTIVASIIASLSLLSQLALWQRKEYRIDRVRSHLTSPQGSLKRHPFLILSYISLGLGWATFIVGSITLAEYLGWLFLICHIAHFYATYQKQGIARPVATQKLIVVTGITAILLVLYFNILFSTHMVWALQLATIIFFIPGLIAIAAQVGNGMTATRKNRLIENARARREKHSQAKVIGITGSYGKTSTKHFLYQILSKTSEDVIATKEHRNAYFTVAQDVLEQLTKDTKTYVVEMGAYKKGEIQETAELTKPSVGIITAIGNQHVDLFKSVEQIANTKWELAHALSKDGTLILNADDENIVAKSKEYSGTTIWYSTQKEADVYSSNVTINPTNIECTLNIQGSQYKVTIPLASTALLSNLLAAIAGAVAIKTDPANIIDCIKDIKPYPQTMEIREGKNNSVVIDDSYSGNEQGVLVAIEHLKRFPQKDKRIILLPLIELGPDGHTTHQRLGAALAESGAKVIVAGEAYSEDILSGAKTTADKHNITIEKNLKRVASLATENITKDTVTLLENRIPEAARAAILA